jgi:prepilin-type N-terminal cleavage/methylation domain-containing protein
MLKQSLKYSSSKGFSLIELLIVVVITGILASIAIPTLMASRRSANEASAVAGLRQIVSGQAAYQFSFGGGNYGTMTQLRNSALIDRVTLATPNSYRKNRYLFELSVLAPTGTLGPRFDVRARPQHHTNDDPIGGAGTRDFGTNESGVLYQTSNATIVAFDSTTRVPTGSAIPFVQH